MSTYNIDYYKKMAFDPRQMQIIRDGLKEGLDVEYYANTQFDYLQMEQIYLALKDGFDEDSLNILCDPRIEWDSMKQMREALTKKLGIYEKINEDIKKKKTMRFGITLLIVLIILIVGCILYVNRQTIGYYFDDMELILKEDHIKLGLSKTFVAGDYVEKYDKDCDLILPKKKKFDEIGSYKLEYKLSNKVKTVKKTLIIDVYDDIAPVVELTTNTIEIDYAGNFIPNDYIKSVTDNVDGDLKKDITIDNQVNTQNAGTYTVAYSVKDKEGNEGTALLSVVVKEKAIESKPEQNNNSSNKVSNDNIKPSSGNESHSKVTNPDQYNKYFSGNSIAIYNEALSYAEGLLNSGKINGYSVLPDGGGFNVVCN